MRIRIGCVIKDVQIKLDRSDPRTSSCTSEGTEDEEEILGSDDDEQEDSRDYCKGIIQTQLNGC
jgi:hypothetical protein